MIVPFFLQVIAEVWEFLLDSSVYVLFGICVGGILNMFLSPQYIARHLGPGRFLPVFKAALLGIPLPLCSCGVLPAALALRKQGANKGATLAFLISTPESGVDSISISYALLDPVLTVARPVAAFLTAVVAGIAENIMNPPQPGGQEPLMRACPVDNCCDGTECSPVEHRHHHTFAAKVFAGYHYAIHGLWADLAPWFFIGILLAALITTLVPDNLIGAYLGNGFPAMLLMLLFGIPLYICATASTPIAAALLLKGVSPGAVLVFLLVGPATNIVSLAVLSGVLGKRATSIYLLNIAVVSIICGLALEQIYAVLGISAQAVAGRAAEFVPAWLQVCGALLLLAISLRPLFHALTALCNKLRGRKQEDHAGHDCGCC